jgi:hypothetical protein
LGGKLFGRRGQQCKAKITEEHFPIFSQQHIFGLDIAMDHTVVMGVLQGCGDPLDVGHHEVK